MKTIALMLGGILVIALSTRKFDWRARALLLGALVVMVINLSR